jgi:hypothetical protein
MSFTLKHFSTSVGRLGHQAATLAGLVLGLLLVTPAQAQYEDLAISATTLELTGALYEDPCATFLVSKLFKNAYVTNLPTLSTNLFLSEAFGPISKIDIEINTPLPEAGCLLSGRTPVKLVFDSDLAAVAPRTGLLRNSANLRPAQNVFVQLGLIDTAGVFTPLDLNKPQALNTALSKPSNALGAASTLTLGVRYVAARSFLAQNAGQAADGQGSQDVTAGNVAVFLPFLLKVN